MRTENDSNLGELIKLPSSIHFEGAVSSKLDPESRFNGRLSRPLWEKAHAVKSAYPDSFDYGIYDQILQRFGNEPPRGGVVFKTALKLVNHHSSCSQCHYAFEIDTYGRGCVHDCTYCYAKEILSRHAYWNKPFPFPVDIAEIRKTFATVFESDRSSKWRPILEKRIPLRIGSMSDSFMWMDKKYKVTLELLKILKFYEYPYVIFTRSDLVANDEYLRFLDPKLASIQFSIAGGNEELTSVIEPGAPSVSRRLKALKKLADSGFWTTVRINPLFPIHPDGYFTDREKMNTRFSGTIPKFELFSFDFISTLKEFKVPSVLAGFVRLSPQAISSISKESGVNLKEFFKPEAIKSNGDKKFSDLEIRYYYNRIHSECLKNGIRFSTCYIGNGEKDYFQYQSLWSNKGDCCDARGNVAAIKSTSQDINEDLRMTFAPPKPKLQNSFTTSATPQLLPN